MKRIFKYQLLVTHDQTIKLPKGARVLSVGAQGNKVFLWALVDDKEEIESVPFTILGTGEVADVEHCTFLGTVMLYDGELVLHVFVPTLYIKKEDKS